MVEHVVLFKTSPGAPESARQAMIDALAALRHQVPGILDLSVGRNFSDRNQGYDVGLVVRFESRAALEAYLPHPAHRAAVDRFVAPIKEDVLVVDYDL